VNYNDTATDQAEKELAKKYGVTYQHTFVQIDAEGNEVTKWNGGKIEELLHNIR
jgi:thioredoxin-related protein